METTKVLTKEEIQAALEERHSPEKQKKLSDCRQAPARSTSSSKPR